jgi:hypothetical protein
MTFDGETVSLRPSVGNWNLACRSHYVTERGRVHEAGPWTDAQIAAERQRDKAAKARHYGTPKQPKAKLEPVPHATSSRHDDPGFRARVRRWLSRRRR